MAILRDLSAEGKKQLASIVLLKGRGYAITNLQTILDCLWEIADCDGIVHRELYEQHMQRLGKYFTKLHDCGCVALSGIDAHGGPYNKITLLKRQVPQKKKTPPKHVSQPTPVVHPRQVLPIIKPTPPQCLVFVDVSNICCFFEHGDTVGNKATYLHPKRARWDELRQMVLEMTRIPLENQSVYAYARASNENRLFDIPRNDLYRMKGAGFTVITRDEKDLDAYMIPDICYETLPYIKKGAEVTLVIVAGDSDYTRVLQRTRDWGQRVGTRVKFFVISWQRNMSFKLLNVVSKKNFVALEGCLERLDPVGARMFAKHKELKRTGGSVGNEACV
jgi:hypothetical protein